MQASRATARLGLHAAHLPSRSFSTSRAVAKEIQDAYILSAARTPVAKVRYLVLD
jgi:acetyl-CoA C-acetyltransferase